VLPRAFSCNPVRLRPRAHWIGPEPEETGGCQLPARCSRVSLRTAGSSCGAPKCAEIAEGRVGLGLPSPSLLLYGSEWERHIRSSENALIHRG
jgi:hypothetical protein